MGYERPIEAASSAIAVVKSDTVEINAQATPQKTPCALYAGVGGDIKVKTANDEEVTFKNVPDGTFIPVLVKQVFDTGTDATAELLALR